MTLKKPGWDLRLTSFLTQMRDCRFAYGKHDCGSFAIRCGRIMCGEDSFKTAPQWGSKKEIKDRELSVVRETIRVMHEEGCHAIDVEKAALGDIVIYDGALGVCTGYFSLFVSAPSGLRAIDTGRCDYAWRI